MRRYIRAYQNGGVYFFTVNLAERRDQCLLVERIDDLRDALAQTKRDHPFVLIAMVVMPDHFHLLIELPEHDANFATRIMLIKSRFSRAQAKTEQINASRSKKRERGIWQRRYWEHLIRDDEDLGRHIDYIHYNPVKHQHAKRASDWPYSTIRRYIQLGWYAPDWAAEPEVIAQDWR